MKRLILAASILGIVAALSPPVVQAVNDRSSDSWQQPDEHIKRGERAAAHDKWTEARDEFAAAAKLDTKNVVAFYDLGIAQAHLGDFDNAADSEHRAIDIDSNYTQAYVELGWILTRLGDYDAAASAEKKALELEPGNKTAQKNLDSIQHLLMRSQPASPIIPMPARKSSGRGVLTDDPESPQSAARLVSTARDEYSERKELLNNVSEGESAFAKGQIGLARQYFEQAILLSDKNSAAHAGLGVILGGDGNIDAELVEEKRAVEIDPKNAAAYSNIGWVESKKQHWSEALRNYNQALSLEANLQQASVGKAIALYHLGKKTEAISLLKAGIDAAPDNAALRIAMGTLLAQGGQPQQAITQLKKGLELQPANVVAKQQLALALLAEGDATESAKLFRQLIAAADDVAESHAGLSLALEMQGDHAAAESEARCALGLDPRMQIAQATLERLERRKTAARDSVH